jgi:hypothetical protein
MALAKILNVSPEAIRSTFQPALQPILVTSLDCSGATWLMRLLAAHPAIVVHGPYPYETRIASYWMQMMKQLSEPTNQQCNANFDGFLSDVWPRRHPAYMEAKLNHPQMNRWSDLTYVERLAARSQHIIDSFYGQVANAQQQAGAFYFAEKYHPDYIPRLIWKLYPCAREIFLVRDFRDMLCSMPALNTRQGYASDGRKLSHSDKAFVSHIQLAAQNFLNQWKSRSNQGYLLHYEDLILNPRETVAALLSYLDLDAASEMIKEVLHRASKDTPAFDRHKISLDPGASIGRWRNDLDPSTQRRCQELLGEVLAEFGYPESG